MKGGFLMIVNIKRLDDEAVVPTKGSDYAAGLDLYARITTDTKAKRVSAGQTEKIGTGIAVEIPNGYFGAIFARSGLATKQGLRPANCVGVIDSDYRGEIIVAIHSDSDLGSTIRDGDRIGAIQLPPSPPQAR